MEHLSWGAFWVLAIIAWSAAGFSWWMDKRRKNGKS